MADEPAAPRVFISHASEDKAFVLDFATRLRERGIDAWLDRWEILPGDSLVEKVFEQGIAPARAIIVVVSRASVVKPWVREELNVAVARKIDAVSKLIPVVIGDCEVPESLRATVWEKIDDLTSYEPSLDRIVRSIFGVSDKPKLGSRPAFAAGSLLQIGDLVRVDSLVLQAACELCLEDGYSLRLLGGDLPARTAKIGISGEATWESARILRNRGYLEEDFHGDDPLVPGEIAITQSGFEEYLKAHWPGYEDLLRSFASNVINQDMLDRDAMKRSLDVPDLVLDHVFDRFRERKWIFAERYPSGIWEFAPAVFSPEMKRWLES